MNKITAKTLRMPQTLFESLKNSAKEYGVTLNGLIVRVLWEWLEKRNIKEDGVSND